jgi:high-affinity nickel permease
MSIGFLGLIGLGLVLGARHSIDLDHIAAITDFLGAEEGKKKGFTLSLFYILGHELVNLVLGLVAVLIGHNLPAWIDNIMERVVGLLLVMLGAWVLVILFNNRYKPVMISRWKLLFMGMRKLYHKLSSRVFKKHQHHEELSWDIGPKSAFGIGILHGIGGETGSQVLLFMTAAGAGTVALGISTVIAFIVGLFLAQLLIALFLLAGYARVARSPKIYNGVAFLTSLYSLIVGAVFLVGKSNILP